MPQGSSTFKHHLKGRLAKSQTPVKLTATVSHITQRKDTEILSSPWESNWSDSGQHHVTPESSSLWKLPLSSKPKQKPTTVSMGTFKISLVLQITGICVFSH